MATTTVIVTEQVGEPDHRPAQLLLGGAGRQHPVSGRAVPAQGVVPQHRLADARLAAEDDEAGTARARRHELLDALELPVATDER
jgi:hypothetical protein